jgi:hypothetical protein
LRQQEAEAQAAQREHEAAHPRTLTREMLLARLGAKARAAGSARGLVNIAADFDAPLADFDAYMNKNPPKQ